HRILAPSSIGGKIEMLLLEHRQDLKSEFGPNVWEGAFHSSRRQVPGFRFGIPKPDGSVLVGEIVRGSSESASGTVVVRFEEDPLASGAGELPLPHYIEKPTADDENSYQTVYAKTLGSAAAPTAGLHFTTAVLERLRERGVDWTEVTLHVGLGTFRPVKT